MKFNEKIIKLRKEKGLSQEQLGYELGVTRQTVSKWELGITTPEMDKLVEMSELFNISLDELLKGENNSQEANDGENVKQPIYNNYTNNQKTGIPLILKILIIVVIISLIIGLICLIINGITKYNNDKKDREYKEKIQEKVIDQFDKTNDTDVRDIINYYKDNNSKEANDNVNENQELINKAIDAITKEDPEIEKSINEIQNQFNKMNVR